MAPTGISRAPCRLKRPSSSGFVIGAVCISVICRAQDFPGDRVEDAVYVPVTSVFQEGGKQICYLVEDGGMSPVEVKTGRSSDKYVEILSGLEAGQRVLVADTAPRRVEEPANGKGNNLGPR